MKILGFGRNKNKKQAELELDKRNLKNKFKVSQSVLKGLIGRLDSIRLVFKSTEEKAEIQQQLIQECKQYDDYIASVRSLILRVLEREFAKNTEELKLLEEWLFKPLLEAMIGENYDVSKAKYENRKAKLELVIERIKDLEEGKLPAKVQIIEDNFAKAA